MATGGTDGLKRGAGNGAGAPLAFAPPMDTMALCSALNKCQSSTGPATHPTVGTMLEPSSHYLTHPQEPPEGGVKCPIFQMWKGKPGWLSRPAGQGQSRAGIAGGLAGHGVCVQHHTASGSAGASEGQAAPRVPPCSPWGACAHLPMRHATRVHSRSRTPHKCPLQGASQPPRLSHFIAETPQGRLPTPSLRCSRGLSRLELFWSLVKKGPSEGPQLRLNILLALPGALATNPRGVPLAL